MKKIGILTMVFLLMAVLTVMATPAAAGVAPPGISELEMVNAPNFASVGIPAESQNVLFSPGLSFQTAIEEEALSIAELLLAVSALGWLIYDYKRRASRRRLSLKVYGVSSPIK